MIDVEVAAEACRAMGLDNKSIDALTMPIRSASGYWRLPLHECGMIFKVRRGVPQGLSASVLLAEVFLSMYLWRLSLSAPVEIVAYVDDLTVIAHSPAHLALAIRQLRDFESIFCLNVSELKTFLWGHCLRDVVEIAEDNGVSVAESVVSLGTEWALYPTSKCSYSKPCSRIDKALERLRRLSHLMAPLIVKMRACQTGCLSLIDYAAPLPIARTTSLRKYVRRACGLSVGAPEIVFGLCVRSSLDPWVHWILVALRFWHSFCGTDEAHFLDEVAPRRSQSVLSAVVRELKKIGLNLTRRSLSGMGLHVTIAWEWSACRPMVLRTIKHAMWLNLETRRPTLYGGIRDSWPSEREHAKMIANLSPYKGKIVMRIWAGVALTNAHRHSLDHSVSDLCPCGGIQTLHHLMYDCSCRRLIPEHLRYWRDLAPVFSSALLYHPKLDKGHWKAMCMRGIEVLTVPMEENDIVPEQEWDPKGHQIRVDDSNTYAYCSKCHISRCIRDIKFIASRPCASAEGSDIREGDSVIIQGHEAQMYMKQWKRGSKRPAFRCGLCEREWWCTGKCTRACTGALP